MIVLPNMGLVKWDSINDYFSHVQLAANMEALDSHNHTAGKGVQIPYGGLAEQSVSFSNLRSDVTEKFFSVSNPSSPPVVYGWIGASAAAGTRPLPSTPAEINTTGGSLESPRAMVPLDNGTKYTAQMLFATGTTAPAVEVEIAVRKLNGTSFNTGTPQRVFLMPKLSTVSVIEFRVAEFEVPAPGFHEIVVVTTAATAVNSRLGVGVSIVR